jgi:ribosomal protein L16 Arg81 hydroxylase
VVFLAAPGSTTPSHVDPEFGFLLHIRGDKRLSIGRFPDGTEQAELDQFYAGGHRNTSDLPVDVRHVDLRPGEAAHVPPHVPHWVTNGEGVTVALSVGFQTEANLARMRTHRFNGSVVRKLGLTPQPVGGSPGRDRAKAAAAKGLAGLNRALRRSH